MKRIVLAINVGVILLITLFFAFFISALVYLGRYTYANPNGPGIYAVVENNEGMYASEAEVSLIEASGSTVLNVTDVHDKFMTWFKWGFWSLLLISTFSFCMCLSVIPSLQLCALPSHCCLLMAYCNSCIWWITGLVWRLQRPSAFASGDIVPVDKTEEEWIVEIDAQGSYF